MNQEALGTVDHQQEDETINQAGQLTRVGTEFAFFSQRCANIVVYNADSGRESFHSSNVVGRNDNIEELALSGVQNVGSKLLNLRPDIIGLGGNPQDFVAVVINLLLGPGYGRCIRKESRNSKG